MPRFPYKPFDSSTKFGIDFAKWINNFVDSVGMDLKETDTNFNNAVETVSNKAFDKVVAAAKIEWLPPVNTFNDLETTYPDVVEGKTVMTRDSGKVYRFDGDNWIEIQDIDPSVINEVDNRLSSQLAAATQQLSQKATKNRKIPGKICTNINFTPGVVEKRNELFAFWKSIGIEKVIITLQLNGPQCTPTEVMDNVIIFLDDVKTMFEVDTLKFHCTVDDLATNLVTQIDYQNSIYTILNSIGDNFENVIILNERADVHNNPDNTTYCVNLIQSIQTRGFNVGISFQGENEALECMQVYNQVFNLLDIIGINCYPSISVEMQATSRNDSVYAWDIKIRSLSFIKSKYPDKKVVISETGILPFWEMLADPWMYDITGKTPASEQVVILFLFGLFENTFASVVDETWFWFLDMPIVDENVKQLYNFENFASFLNSYL
jgi:hypothetical protein